VDDINIGLREIRYEGVRWTGLAQDRVKWRTSVNVFKLYKSRELLDQPCK
jgi:hypothetical protein